MKLPSPRFDAVPENEYAMTTLAKTVGRDVPDVRLVATRDVAGLPADLPEASGQGLAVRRFDRPRPGERIHIEDFAQVFGVYPENKYKKASYGSIARVLWLEAGEEAVTEYTRRLVFNALIGNADAHLKNWSLIYPDGHTPKLAPAYDLVATVPFSRPIVWRYRSTVPRSSPTSTWIESGAWPTRQACLCASSCRRRGRQPREFATCGRPMNRCGHCQNTFAER